MYSQTFSSKIPPHELYLKSTALIFSSKIHQLSNVFCQYTVSKPLMFLFNDSQSPVSIGLSFFTAGWPMCDWQVACPKVDPGGIGKKNQGDSCSKDLSPVWSLFALLCAYVCGHESYVWMSLVSIYERLTLCLPSCQQPLACVCVEACNWLLQLL